MVLMCTLGITPVWMAGQDAGANASAKPPEHFYKLNLTLEDVNDAGKVVNTRTYVATIDTGTGTREIRTGARVPIVTGDAGNSSVTQWQYIDVGVNFDVREVKEQGEKLGFNLTADVSSIASDDGKASSAGGHPVIRSNKWQSTVLIPIGKPTVVFSADDLDSKGKMQVEVTAVKVE
jgi:hypothetical protein